MRKALYVLTMVTAAVVPLRPSGPAAPATLDGRRPFAVAGSRTALATLTTPDFDGDGYADLAIGARTEDFVFPAIDGGAVNVLYGGPDGVSTAGTQLWHQDSSGIEDEVETDDQFGYALGAADFDADGYADLAVGSRNETLGFETQAGAVHILYGTGGGLSAVGSQFWHQDEPDILDQEEDFDHFGDALATGDFDGDGFADLAIGVPGEDIGEVDSAGAVNVLFGSENGLTAERNQFWNQDSPGIRDQIDGVDLFGTALAAGDFGLGAQTDLAVGVPNDDVGDTSAGAVSVIYGSSGGLTADGNQRWHQGSPTVVGVPELGDGFGNALAAGDLGVDGHADLAVGVPFDLVGAVPRAGAVHVFYGSDAGLTATGAQRWHQDSAGVTGVPEFQDGFGGALAMANFGKGMIADLAIGVPDDQAGSVEKAGAVNVLYGTAAGLSATGSQRWHQDTSDVVGVAEVGDDFGGSLCAADFGSGGRADLAIGAPEEAVGTETDSGAVNVLYAAAGGLSTVGNQIWTQDSAEVPEASEEGDRFGAALPGSPWMFLD